MTDQKIEEIRASLDGLADAQVRRVEVGVLRYLLTELDRLNAQIAAIEQYGTEEVNEAVALRHKLASTLVELDRLKADLEFLFALDETHKGPLKDGLDIVRQLREVNDTLKASGTFSDGIEAVLQHKRFVLPVRGDGEEMVPVRCIRALSPQPRPDAQAKS